MPEITEAIVLRRYLEHLEADDIEFLRRRPGPRAELAGLLGDLASCGIDQHRKVQVGKSIWKLLFEQAMSSVDPDRRGYERLFRFLDDYVEFEELIFASDPFYRDHTLHSLWVYFLGEYLYRDPAFEHLYGRFLRRVVAPSAREVMELLGREELVRAAGRDQDAIRCIVALCHDLGYPVKKVEKINRAVARILPHFSVTRYQEFHFEYAPIQQSFLDGLARLLATSLTGSETDRFRQALAEHGLEMIAGGFPPETVEGIRRLPEEARQELGAAFEATIKVRLNHQTYLRILNEAEEYSHGFMSAYLLAKTLPAFTAGQLYHVESEEVMPEFFGMFSKLLCLMAIYEHSSPHQSIRGIHTNGAFLTLVDELEEFSRVSRASQNRQYVDEFCGTALDADDGWLVATFRFDRGDPAVIKPELFFRGKAARFLSLFDVPRLDPEFRLRLVCADRLKARPQDFELELSTGKAVLKVDGEARDPGTYLGSPDFGGYGGDGHHRA